MYNTERIKSLMRRYHLSGCGLAEIVNKDKTYVYGWRTGAKKFKSADEFVILYKLMKHYENLLRLAESDFNAMNKDPSQLTT
jgi:hypothetical protein